MPKVSIGLITYNRPKLLSEVIQNFQRQTFSNFELIVSDNASTDPAVQDVALSAAARDNRIRYIRRDSNIGAFQNFWYVYDQATAPLFMWASDDDVWPDNFIETGVTELSNDGNYSAWFCQVENINTGGGIFRAYPSFDRFNSGQSRQLDLWRYLWEPEVMGKANLIYALFRTDSLKVVSEYYRSREETWGWDMLFVYAYLCRNRIKITGDVTFSKRVDSEMETWTPDDPRAYIYPWDEARRYFSGYMAAAHGTPYRATTGPALALRWVYDVFYHRLKLKRPAPLLPS